MKMQFLQIYVYLLKILKFHCLKQAKSFAKSANLSGAIITKLDGTSRGGVSLAISEEVNLPIRFIGAGEGIKDLRPFNSYEFVEAMLADK